MKEKMTRRNFVKLAGMAVAIAALPGCATFAADEKGAGANEPLEKAKVAGTGGEHYLPYSGRQGAESVVYFTRDLSAAGLLKIYDKVKDKLGGKVAVKLHTGEPHGPNIIPRPWVKDLLQNRLPEGTIIETNTYYGGGRDTTEKHRETLKTNGWTDFTTVDIIDAEGTAMLPVPNGKWFTEMSVGKDMLKYDSLLTLTHFKGHAMGGFGGSNKNLGIGCADGKIGKKMIHAGESGSQWGVTNEEFMERMTESTQATVTHFKDKIAFINVMRNMSVDCDCAGTSAQPVVTPDIGIVASLDILAADQACVDCVYALPEESKHDLVERMESRHSMRQLTYMKEMGMGNDRYQLIDLDNGDKVITAAEAVKDIKGTWGTGQA
ncbi:hypothetical protein SAMN05216582_1182 [Selenomonas ruminantium]|uniref:DUF362 domain-containing protein n=1 Tax=Selenomonas ruminantium TaxID=971 RepID=A0A1M6VD78_SELRU|nr:DUF362 domain-containing protein [Selenomonas ruminantium]SHK79324.1 hypothetical protein SAMN05216582_1182 [Selenomonas ruminantium]